MEKFNNIKNDILNNLDSYINSKEDNKNNLENKLFYNLFLLKKNHNDYFSFENNNKNEQIENDIKNLEIYKYKLDNLKNSLTNKKKVKLNIKDIRFKDELLKIEKETSFKNLKNLEESLSNKLQSEFDNKKQYNILLDEMETEKSKILKENENIMNKFTQLNEKVKDSENYLKLQLLKIFIEKNNVNLQEKYLPLLNNIDNKEFKKFINEILIINDKELGLEFVIHHEESKDLYPYYLELNINKFKVNIHYYALYNIYLLKLNNNNFKKYFKEKIFVNPVNKTQIDINSEYFLFPNNFTDFRMFKSNIINILINIKNLNELFNIIDNYEDIKLDNLVSNFKIPGCFMKNDKLKIWVKYYFKIETDSFIIKKLEIGNLNIFIIINFSINNLNLNFKLLEKSTVEYQVTFKLKNKEQWLNSYSISEKLNILKNKEF